MEAVLVLGDAATELNASVEWRWANLTDYVLVNDSVFLFGGLNSSTEGVSTRYGLPWWAMTIWGLVFGILIMVAVSGNLIVIWIVLGKAITMDFFNYTVCLVACLLVC